MDTLVRECDNAERGCAPVPRMLKERGILEVTFARRKPTRRPPAPLVAAYRGGAGARKRAPGRARRAEDDETGRAVTPPGKRALTPMHQEEWTPPFPLGAYMVESTIGRGGVGVVYKARRVSDEQVLALKVLSDLNPSETRRARFQREAEALGRVRHPGVVRILDAGEAESRSFIAMEFVDGPALDQMTAGRPIDPMRAAAIIERIAQACEAAHGSGIVHRDIKPSNILIGKDGAARITDFGFALDLLDPQRLTQSGLTVGTPLYMSPEQLEGRRVDARTDVFALGVVLHELLTGDVPFHGRDPDELFRAVEAGNVPPPSASRPGVPVALDQICARCYEFESDDRYPSAGALAADLAALREGRALAPVPPKKERPARPDPDAELPADPPRTLRLVIAIVIGAAVGLAIGGGIIIFIISGGSGSGDGGDGGSSSVPADLPEGFAVGPKIVGTASERITRALTDLDARRDAEAAQARDRESTIAAALSGGQLVRVGGFDVEPTRVAPQFGTSFELLPPHGEGDRADFVIFRAVERDRLAITVDVAGRSGERPGAVVLLIRHRAEAVGPADGRIHDSALRVLVGDEPVATIHSFSGEPLDTRLLVTDRIGSGPTRIELRLPDDTLTAHLVSRLEVLVPKRP